MLENKKILLIVAGGIAAVKVPDLIRRLRERGASVTCILTNGGSQFITPLTLASLSGNMAYQDLFSLTEESEMGHIRLCREADIILVAPATADVMAKMTVGIADDLATTVLLASDKPVIIAPSMNVMMWTHPATQTNLQTLKTREVQVIGPGTGDLACGEIGDGRMAEVSDIIATLSRHFQKSRGDGPLKGCRAVVTSGPTHEPIDPVRYITNRSSGKQGHAIATALANFGASVTLVTGPTSEPNPDGTKVVNVQTAAQMMKACGEALPAEILVCAAAVADWSVAGQTGQKIKKGVKAPALKLAENPDILATFSKPGPGRPTLVVGFAAETENLITNAQLKRASKNCDWIVANDVSVGSSVFSGDSNTVHLVTADGVESWPTMSKSAVAERIAERIVKFANKNL
ncbi:MAG TPA: bifunctional phosphopantothenoylcysteine decarboxylase/phosphopantothenate--cysteine ligase CoaBC [Rhodospirillaceae bacterium]|nr:bifunctional phosphopantothenoylcysteine decarboxylase/phosphopantothenate--cysteine ligase CoaBC [Candidatus Neomarinimicrobiota bacterium]HCX14015.1 bifunctional phosphopantothenoylcysteine decarboxylase/phosphopantothenate--cysteine ligase CoaBC [Rhodospirillaceae bacterium]